MHHDRASESVPFQGQTMITRGFLRALGQLIFSGILVGAKFLQSFASECDIELEFILRGWQWSLRTDFWAMSSFASSELDAPMRVDLIVRGLFVFLCDLVAT